VTTQIVENAKSVTPPFVMSPIVMTPSVKRVMTPSVKRVMTLSVKGVMTSSVMSLNAQVLVFKHKHILETWDLFRGQSVWRAW
jgi:hypothetical protein